MAVSWSTVRYRSSPFGHGVGIMNMVGNLGTFFARLSSNLAENAVRVGPRPGLRNDVFLVMCWLFINPRVIVYTKRSR